MNDPRRRRHRRCGVSFPNPNRPTTARGKQKKDRTILKRGREQKTPLSQLEVWGDPYSVKEEGHCRLLLENSMGLGLTHRKNPKIAKLRKICQAIQADGYGGVETNVNYSMLRSQQRLESVMKSERDLRIVAAHNKHEKFNPTQKGGTCLMLFDLMASLVVETDPDPSGLGRWVSMKIRGNLDKCTRIVAAYIPSHGNRKGKNLSTVHAQ